MSNLATLCRGGDELLRDVWSRSVPQGVVDAHHEGSSRSWHSLVAEPQRDATYCAYSHRTIAERSTSQIEEAKSYGRRIGFRSLSAFSDDVLKSDTGRIGQKLKADPREVVI